MVADFFCGNLREKRKKEISRRGALIKSQKLADIHSTFSEMSFMNALSPEQINPPPTPPERGSLKIALCTEL
jgi:hypothetical protein